MRKLFVYLKDYKKESIIAPLFKMLEALFDLLVPLVVASIINKGIKYGDKPYIYQMCAVLILLAPSISLPKQRWVLLQNCGARCFHISSRYPLRSWIRRGLRRL